MKRGGPRHPKVKDLMDALDIRCLATAVGYLELLWHFTAEFAPRGDIGRYSDARIEGALGWRGRRGRLIQLLTTTRWLDEHDQSRLVVHDWPDHADHATRKKLQRASLSFVTVTQKVTGHRQEHKRQTTADNGSLPEPEPEPEPEPAAASDHGTNGNGRKTPPPNNPVQDWTEEALERYPGAGVLPGSPDDEIVKRCAGLGLARAQKIQLESPNEMYKGKKLRDWPVQELAQEAISLGLKSMAKARKAPSTSWAWFPKVLAQYIGD